MERAPCPALRALNPCSSSWVDGHAMCTHTLHCLWMTTLYQRGCRAHLPIHTWNHLQHLSICALHSSAGGASFAAPGCSCAMIKVPGLTRCPSFVAPFSIGHCLSSVVMWRSDRIIILQLGVVTSCNRFYHHSFSSSESTVQVLSCSHEILPSSVGCILLSLRILVHVHNVVPN